MATTPSTTNAHSNPNENTHRWLSAIKPFCTKSSQDFDLDEKQEGKTPSYFSKYYWQTAFHRNITHISRIRIIFSTYSKRLHI